MPTQTNFNVSPYFDDFNENKDFYKILFRPGVSVQVRELNQLQTILQHQIERFGDNIFKRGTIVDGCDLSFHPRFPYVKIRDTSIDRQPINVAQFHGYHIKNQANVAPLIASIQTVTSGFESRSPDLNTLYVRYMNSGYANNGVENVEELTFSANQVLTIYNPRNVIERITSFDDSSGFSNNDVVVILPAIAVQNTTGGKTLPAGTFQVNHSITDGTANSVIVAVDTTSNADATILRIRPTAIDLSVGNTDMWNFSTDTRITTPQNPSVQANVVGIVGSGAAAILTTGALGEVDNISITSKGSGYYVLPTVAIASTTADVGEIEAADLRAQNYLTQVSVANNAFNPVGDGYGITVGPGVIYQKGHFVRVSEHLVVVDKYSNTPDAKSVGFDTSEYIINSNQDPSLLDNATGAPNSTAPGANRLKLTPTLVVLASAVAEANTDFMPIVEFSEGMPYKQNRQTQYNIIGNEIARRTYEESGNYVLDPFLMNTRAANTFSDESTLFNIRIDPGLAYINGKRVETTANFNKSVRKGTTTTVATAASISMNFGSYIRIKELGGTFIFKNGDLISLYGGQSVTGAQYITRYAGQTPAASQINIPAGTPGSGLLGTARIRSIILEDGIPGTAEAVYRLYLFDVRVAVARNFSLTRSVFYNGTTKAIADVVLEGGDCVLKDNTNSTLLYYAGKDAVKTATGISYVYKTYDTDKTLQAATGQIAFDVPAPATFPYVGQLSLAQEDEIQVMPLANVRMASNIAGQLSTNPATNQVNGTSTVFTSSLRVGDFIRIANSTANSVVQVNNIANDTVLYVRSNSSIGITAANATVYFPQNVPISFRQRDTRTISVDSEANTMTISLGGAVNATVTAAVSYNVRSGGTSAVAKTATRNKHVRLRLSNNLATNNGPWALGVTDVFRLKGVYLGSNATFSSTDAGVVEVTNDFYIDHNQNESYYNTSYLYKKPGSPTNLTTSDFLLVKFDYFAHAAPGGLKGPGASGTYSINDTVPLESATTTINTLEIPEVFGTQGKYYDLRDHFDLRPTAINTVTPTDTPSTAPINPQEPADSVRFDSGADMKFPSPDSTMQASIEYYNGRVDRVVIDESNRFRVIEGESGTGVAPLQPENSLTINILNIPPYPSTPYSLSPQTIALADTGIANEKYAARRFNTYRVVTPLSDIQRTRLQPRGYTMEQIGKLEKRITDLEYYTSFSLVESRVQKKVIPSSANSAINRAKFGFFVDNFNDWSFADVDNPGYRAAIVEGYLSPPTTELCITTYPTQPYVSLPFNEYTLISQPRATNGPVIQPPVNEPSTLLVPSAPTPTQPETTTSAPAVETSAPVLPVVDTDTGTVTIVPVQYETNITTQDTGTVGAETPLPGTESITPPSTPVPLTPSPQPESTVNPVIEPPTLVVIDTFDGGQTVVEDVLDVVTQTTTTVIQNNIHTSRSDTPPYVYEEFEYVMSATSGNVEFFIISRDNNFAFEIFQGTTTATYESYLSSSAAAAINSVDVAAKGLNLLGQKIEHVGDLRRKNYGPVGYFLEDQGKISWTHDPALGRYYKIRIYKGKKHGGFLQSSRSGTFVYKLYYPTDSVVNRSTNVPLTTNYNSNYEGQVSSTPTQDIMTTTGYTPNNYDSEYTVALETVEADNIAPAASAPLYPTLLAPSGYIASEQSVVLEAYGLKPNTIHTVEIDGVTLSGTTANKVKQEGKLLGDSLMSDGSGVLRFTVFFGSGVDATTSAQMVAGMASMSAGRKSINIINTDGSSFATCIVDIPTYVIEEQTATTDTATSGLYIDSGKASGKGFVEGLADTEFQMFYNEV